MAYKRISPQPVVEGGTGAITLTGVLTGNGTSAITANTVTQHGSLIAGASNAVSSLGVATNGQLAIGSTGADPVLATISAGAGIAITNAAGSITIAASGAGFTWNEITATSATMAVENGYIANNAGLVTLTLPAAAALGTVIQVVGKGAGLYAIAQGAGQTIRYGNTSTTTGVGGSLTAVSQYNALEFVCITANTDFAVLSSVGNFTIV